MMSATNEEFILLDAQRNNLPHTDEAYEIDDILAPLIAPVALGVLSFMYSALALDLFDYSGKSRDLILFFVSTLALAPLCVFINGVYNQGSRTSLYSNDFETLHVWLAITGLTAFTVLTLCRPITDRLGVTWVQVSELIVIVVAGFNVVLIFARWKFLKKILHNPYSSELDFFRKRPFQITSFMAVLSIALFVQFWMQKVGSKQRPIESLFITPTSLAFAAFVIGIVIYLGVVELRLNRRQPALTSRLGRIGLICAISFIFVAFFDYSLSADGLHYMTTVAPALQLGHGGVLMVDTFSQYGPGPILISLLGLTLGPDTLATANIVVQLCNLTFYSVWLVCLYRLSPLRLPALALGLVVIAMLLAIWGLGYRNINFAPSIIGFRHLPALLMVLAISFLQPNKTNSIWTAAAAMLATLWSIEAFIGAVGIHMAFIGMLGMCEHEWRRIIRDGVLALFPALLSIMLLAAYTVMMAGVLPNYKIYLEYLEIYNLTSPYWSIPANSLFLGWGVMLLVVLLVFAESWRRIFYLDSAILALKQTTLYYKAIPMALLCILMSTYYLGRSVEYTLVLALLAFSGLAIPAALYYGIWVVARAQYSKLLLLALPTVSIVLGFAFSFAALSRHNAPYAFYLHECRDRGVCTIASLTAVLKKRLHSRSIMERVGNGYRDTYFDRSGAVRDAVGLIGQLQPQKDLVTVLIGPVRNIKLVGDVRDHIASDAAVMHAGKWHTWPRSNTFADELLTSRIHQILAAPVTLKDGELVIVRRNEALLGKIESGILRKIRSEVLLCRLSESTKNVTAYRVSRSSRCPQR